MILRDLLDLAGKEKRKKEREKAAQQLAVGVGIGAAVGLVTGILFAPRAGKETREDIKQKATNTANTIKDAVQEKVETIKESAVHAAQEVRNAIKDIHAETERVKEEIKCGSHVIVQDSYRTADNISDGSDRTVK
jgi:gas vesicle protein